RIISFRGFGLLIHGQTVRHFKAPLSEPKPQFWESDPDIVDQRLRGDREPRVRDTCKDIEHGVVVDRLGMASRVMGQAIELLQENDNIQPIAIAPAQEGVRMLVSRCGPLHAPDEIGHLHGAGKRRDRHKLRERKLRLRRRVEIALEKGPCQKTHEGNFETLRGLARGSGEPLSQLPEANMILDVSVQAIDPATLRFRRSRIDAE
ncbi:MAG: hypothetical protein AAF253_12230, partial [Pseudomonadota bacterium]